MLGSQIQIYDFVRESHQKILTQVNSVNLHVLFYCRTKSVSVTQNITGFIHRCSQGGQWGHSPIILEHIVVLCFDRWYPKQNSVNSFPIQFLGWLRY